MARFGKKNAAALEICEEFGATSSFTRQEVFRRVKGHEHKAVENALDGLVREGVLEGGGGRYSWLPIPGRATNGGLK